MGAMNRFYPRGVWRGAVLSVALLLAGGVGAKAGETKLAPLMTEPAESLVNDTFATSLPKAWRGAKGTWVCEGGAVRGLEVAADKHQAVIRRPLAFTNAIITFSFRLDGARQISLSVNDAKEHVCRVIINAKGFTVEYILAKSVTQKADAEALPDKTMLELAILARSQKVLDRQVQGETPDPNPTN